MTDLSFDRRTLFKSAAALTLAGAFPAWARSGTAGLHPAPGVLSGDRIALTVGDSHFGTAQSLGGRSAHAIAINGTIPAPLKIGRAHV